MKNLLLYKNERIDDLQVPLKDGKSLCIIQNPDYFCFGLDAVLLAHFAHIPKNASAADLGCGCGIIPLLLAAKTNVKHITGLEIQKEIAQMAQRSVAFNKLDDKITILDIDFKHFEKPSHFDVITCNPPYKEIGGGLLSKKKHLAIARHEICCTLAEVMATSTQLLKPNGRLSLIHRPERIADIICEMRAAKIEPKRIQFVYSRPKKAAISILIEGIKGGKPKILFKPPLYVYNENNEYTDEIRAIYRGLDNICLPV